MKMLIHSRYRAVLLLLGIISTGPAIAKMYKWVDADGNTQYTQLPPPGDIKAETIKEPPKIDTESAVKELEAKQKKLEEINKTRDEKKKAELKEQEHAALIKENCKQAKSKLENNQNTGRIRAVDEEGNVVRAPEEERQRRIKEAQEAVNKWCNR